MRKHCGCIVWISKDMQVERIYLNKEFWLDCFSCAELLFKNSFFDRSPETQTLSSTAELHSPPTCEVYCYCQGPGDGNLVGLKIASVPTKGFIFHV